MIKYKSLVIFFFCLFATGLQAQRHDAESVTRPKVGVVLGGGGAKGASHIGVLKYLEELGIPVDYVAGTSMGSIIGGLYAMGYDPDEMTVLISQIPWNEYIGNKIDRSTMSAESRWRNSTTLLNIPFNLDSVGRKKSNASLIGSLPGAYVNNSALINLFNDLCIGYQEEMDFDDMPIPFACVATDLITGNEVVIRRGVVPQAMRASMAIPGVFSPVIIGDNVLVDGGLVNNFPADVLRAMGADIVIGVEVTSEKTFTVDMLKSLPQVMSRLLTNVTNAKRKENRLLCDVHIVPDITGYGMLSFTPEAIETLVGRGYSKAQEYREELMAIKEAVDKAAGYAVGKELHAPKSLNLMTDSVFIREINITGIDTKDIKWMVRKGGLKSGTLYSKEDIEKAINIYRGTSCFDEITYTITENENFNFNVNLNQNDSTNNDTTREGEKPEGRESTYNLTINMIPSKPHVFGFGTRYDSEEGAALLFNIGLYEKAFKGHKLSMLSKLSYSPRIELRYTFSQPSLANFNVAYNYRDEHFTSLLNSKKSINLHYRQNRVGGYISQFHLLDMSATVGMTYQRTTYDATSLDDVNYFDTNFFVGNSTLEPYFNLVYDNMDDAYFARRGIYARFGSHYYYEPKRKENSMDFCYSFQSNITPNDGKFTIIPQLYGRYVIDPHYYNQWILFGGEIAGRHFDEQLPFIGYSSVQDMAFDNNISIIRLDVRYNLYGKHYLTAMCNYLFNWAALDVVSMTEMLRDTPLGAGLKYSYKSLLGPISMTLHWVRANERNHFGGYLSIGYTF